MLSRTLSGIALLAAVAAVARAEPPAVRIEAYLVKVPVRAGPGRTAGPTPSLLPDERDQVAGNAATCWLRAGIAFREVRFPWTEKVSDWESTARTPLRALPRDEVRKMLDAYKDVLRLADLAARCDHCDWGIPPVTVPQLETLPLVDVQPCRLLVVLLKLRARLELADGRPERALRSVQVGLALARDLGHGPTVVHGLVGAAIAAIMLSCPEEILQQPDAPNLYWALTELPGPLIDLRSALRSELGMLYRTYPELRRLDEGTLSGPQAEAILKALLPSLKRTVYQPSGPPRYEGLDLKTLTANNREEARHYLAAHGWTAEAVRSLTDTQAVALYLLTRYREGREEILHWTGVPPWQGRAALLRLDGRLREDAAKLRGNVLSALLLLSVAKTEQAASRVEEWVAALRCVEAVRLHAAAHDGKLPASLGEVTEVPLPVNPFTGKGFDGDYKVRGDTAVLDMPPPPGMPANLGRRYALTRSP